MKEYLLFAGHSYYPEGGMLDFKFGGTLEECKQYFEREYKRIANDSYINNWGHIVDRDTLIVVLCGHLNCGKTLREPGELIWSEPENV